MPDLKNRDHFAIFSFRSRYYFALSNNFDVLVTPVGLFGLQVKILANWCKNVEIEVDL